MTRLSKSARVMLTTLAAVAIPFYAAWAASEFAGTWKVKDGNGKDFQIVLTEAGDASADRSGEGMKGTWSEEGGAAVIKWDTGWTTKITKEGDGFIKTAYEQGKAVPKEGNTSPAEKVK